MDSLKNSFKNLEIIEKNTKNLNFIEKITKNSIFLENVCENCGKMYEHRSSLSRHKKKCINKKNKFICEKCGKEYKYKSGLSRHQIKCLINLEENNLIHNNFFEENKKITNYSNMNNDMMEMMMNTMNTMHKVIDKLEKSTGNTTLNIVNNTTNNTTINIINYLNDTCRNAINLADFVDNIKSKIDIKDVERITNSNVVEQLENNFVNNLNNMIPIERPIHCADKMNGDFYIKDIDGWSSNNSREKIINMIETLVEKQIVILEEWKELNTNWTEDKQKQKFVNDAMNKLIEIYGDKTQQKIINLLKQFHLDIS